MEITYPVDLKPIIQQLKVPQGSDGVVEFSAWYEQLEAYFAQHRVLKALFHAVQYEPVCPQFMDEDIKHMTNPIKPYTETIERLHLPSTPGGKIKQHPMHESLPSGAVILEEPITGVNLAERMANAQTQDNTNLNDGQNSDNGEKHNDNAAEDDNDSSSVNSDFVIESMPINPKAFTFRQITMSPTEAAMRKLTHLEGQAIHHIYKVFKYGIAICAEAVRISSAIQAPDYITLRNHLIAYFKLVTSTKESFEKEGVF